MTSARATAQPFTVAGAPGRRYRGSRQTPLPASARSPDPEQPGSAHRGSRRGGGRATLSWKGRWRLWRKRSGNLRRDLPREECWRLRRQGTGSLRWNSGRVWSRCAAASSWRLAGGGRHRQSAEGPFRVTQLSFEQLLLGFETGNLDRLGFGETVHRHDPAAGRRHQTPFLLAGDRIRVQLPQVTTNARIRQPDLGAMTLARATWRIHSSS